VPIIADEARTFGMADLFRQVGIYAPIRPALRARGPRAGQLLQGGVDGQILEEGITEAGAIASWVAAATSYSAHGFAMLPFYIYYSMFGFQRVGDAIWAAADSRSRGFLLGATAGRTTLAGEGLQHQDGTSHLVACTMPNCRAYDPCFAYELALILEDGMRRMLGAQEDVFYYVTVMNENYAQPSAPPLPSPEGPGERGRSLAATVDVRRHPPRPVPPPPQHQRRGQSATARRGTILREALAAAELLENDFGIGADVYSVTSFTELRREAMALERSAGSGRGRRGVDRALLPANGTPIVAASDYVSALPDLIRPWIRDRYVVLGTDGFGRSDTRAALRRFFEVDRHAIAVAALSAIDPALARPRRAVRLQERSTRLLAALREANLLCNPAAGRGDPLLLLRRGDLGVFLADGQQAKALRFRHFGNHFRARPARGGRGDDRVVAFTDGKQAEALGFLHFGDDFRARLARTAFGKVRLGIGPAAGESGAGDTHRKHGQNGI
jgi:pyruvate dehydrogenase E1 component